MAGEIDEKSAPHVTKSGAAFFWIPAIVGLGIAITLLLVTVVVNRDAALSRDMSLRSGLGKVTFALWPSSILLMAQHSGHPDLLLVSFSVGFNGVLYGLVGYLGRALWKFVK